MLNIAVIKEQTGSEPGLRAALAMFWHHLWFPLSQFPAIILHSHIISLPLGSPSLLPVSTRVSTLSFAFPSTPCLATPARFGPDILPSFLSFNKLLLNTRHTHDRPCYKKLWLQHRATWKLFLPRGANGGHTPEPVHDTVSQ